MVLATPSRILGPTSDWASSTALRRRSRRRLPGQDVAILDDEEFFGYAVDAGTGPLADQLAIEALSKWDYERVDEVCIPAQVPDDPIEGVIAAVVKEKTQANVYVVGSGWGDGVYATYVGRAADGRIASFVTDFRVVPLD
ncbi:DUF4241 domain-containing protein [Micromonospora sp. NPDC000729]|uniref:DUF4241 domain-containing protein n=1 Tax=Micromonospora sp. NPDC000729 TaxID=3364220 RepID=UPI003682B389